MPAENPRYAAYFDLVHRAEELSFWSSTDSIIVSGLVGFAQAILDGEQAGLTPHEIRTAVAIRCILECIMRVFAGIKGKVHRARARPLTRENAICH